ncbi:hypothetical protein CLV48_106196 [Cecembia rubra]|uniref:UDP-glycosyltransferase n=1 Tax=Cecembia rubra TaxID=1485585 RepID=A0A2P8E3A6_9BACT|nr:hypothetical protein CLV48_106196 [Cecembia rubra]
MILLPDGVGLRNFAYTNFVDEAKKSGLEVVFWNNTKFDLNSLGLRSIPVPRNKFHILSDLVKRAKIDLFLEHFAEIKKDEVYLSYKFKNKNKPLKSLIKNYSSFLFKFIFRIIGPLSAQKFLNFLESNTDFYKACKNQLIKEKPDFIFSTNQRALSSLAPILAAKSLGIPTSAFIFSWDNLPKATMVVDTDYYFVWSEYMENELIDYYSIGEEKIKVTGTTQFEPYYDSKNIIPKDEFYSQFGLNSDTKYICFSGDDITTSPFDPNYLRDLAELIQDYNQSKGSNEKVGILFRRCPVDKSNRYDLVLEQFKEIIKPIDPEWRVVGEAWNEVMAMPNDIKLLVSSVYYSECVVNVGSSMVFDFANFDKPCFYINYEVDENKDLNWSINQIYNYIHFRSMPDKQAVGWINSKADFFKAIHETRNSQKSMNVSITKKWFEIIVQHPVESSSKRIAKAIKSILEEQN